LWNASPRELAPALDPVLTSLRADRLLLAADRWSALADQMDTFALGLPPSRRGACASRLRRVDARFRDRAYPPEALIDAQEHAHSRLDWRKLIANGRLVKALEPGGGSTSAN